MSFNLGNLKSGMVVECRNGWKAVVISGSIVDNFDYMILDEYNDDLTFRPTIQEDTKEWDIVNVWEACGFYGFDTLLNGTNDKNICNLVYSRDKL